MVIAGTVVEVDSGDELFQMCSYLIKTTNLFFRTIRAHGVFLRGDACTIAHTVGHEMNAAWKYI